MASFLSGCVFLLVVSAAYVRGYRFFIQVKDDVRNNPPPARPTLQLAEVQFFYSNQPIPSSTFTAISSSLDGDGLGSLFDNNTMSFASTNVSSSIPPDRTETIPNDSIPMLDRIAVTRFPSYLSI